MKVVPVGSTPPIQQEAPAKGINPATKARVISMLQGNQHQVPAQVEAPKHTAQEHPVANANNVSPEELSAIKAPATAEAVDNPTPIEVTQEAPKQTAKDPETERRFAEIARQERILRARAQKQAQELKTQQATLEAQKADLDAKAKQYDPSNYIEKSRLKADPLTALSEAEVTYDELTQRYINQGTVDPRVEAQIKRLEGTIANLQTKLEQGEKQVQENQTSQYKAAIKQIETDARELVASEPDTYEAIAKTNSISDVVDLIERTYQQDGVVMTVDQAAKEVEDYLVEEGFKTISRIEKIKKRLAPASDNASQVKQVQQTQAKPADTKQPGTMKTLTNATSSTRQLTARERALLAFKGELKD